MATLTLKIKTDNASFGDNDAERDDELARILEKLSKDLRDTHAGGGLLFDRNGNRVGSWKIE